MKKLLSFLSSRGFVASVVLVLLALGVWFLGPYVAFGGLKPLESIALRVLIIVLLACAVLLWVKRWSMAAVLVALLCLLIWYAAPLLSFSETKPFEPVEARVIAIAVVIALFAMWCLYRLWQRMRRDPHFLRKTLAVDHDKGPSAAAARLREIEARMSVALDRLRTMRTGAHGIARLFQGTRHLYQLPWFIALGSDQSGKTRVISNAGLALPAGSAPSRASSTRSSSEALVDWWLTNDAVFIDTAGHFVHFGSSRHSLPPPVAPKQNVDDTITQRLSGVQPSSEKHTADLDQTGYRRWADTDEWFGFLRMLRRRRPRAPINGALLTIKLDLLTHPDASLRELEAQALRARLTDLRATLGIRFPVYLIVTQMDRLPGFDDYFASLTEETRAQIWGFTLPLDDASFQTRYADELAALSQRLSAGINTRLEDEYDIKRRRRLAALPEAFAAIIAPLSDLLAQMFLDSRYDNTQHHSMLRGVYFSSATQGGVPEQPEPLTIMRRLASAFDTPLLKGSTPSTSTHSYFLRDLFARVILPEAHLVRPNLRWEYRSRALRLLGHAAAVLLFVWLALALRVSFGNNSEYLHVIARKAQTLATKVTELYRDPKPALIPDTLTEARYLPTWTGLDLANPDIGFRYGLYAAPSIVDVSEQTYRALEDNLLLPQIVRRMEAVIAEGIDGKDARTTYAALRVYLMLHDRSKYNADEIKTWVFDDWSRTDSASIFGGRASMLGHVEQLFSGERIVQSPLIRNDALIERARAFLDTSNGMQRLYERAKAAMQQDAPDDFTLLRAVGPQAGTVFTRASGDPLSRGVPGLFTFDGYRDVFDKRLTEFVQVARDDDAWVMGRAYLSTWSASGADTAQKKTLEIARAATNADDALTDAIRRLYLTEYAQKWDTFLTDIRPVTGSSLAFNLQILRQFAAPDSPLARLARAAARETTLTQKIASADGTLIDKAASKLDEKAKLLGIRAQERVERELVDNRFAPLREMVTGSTQATQDAQTTASTAGKTGLDGLTTLLNETYTALTIADNALVNNGLPPPSDASAKLKMAAATMPAPFREVLLRLAAQGSRDVNGGVGQLLSRQTQAVVGDACRLAVEGNYPFAPDSNRDISIEDFTRVFAQGGLIDDFFTKNLAPFVDTSAQPWRYKTLPGSTEPVQGPNLEPFQHAQAIRQVFFGEQGKQLAWKAEVRVPELDPTILGLLIDIDGQSTQYQHGPVTPLKFSWPGPRGGVHVELTANPRIRADTSTIATDGPWALMRLLRRGQIVQTATLGRTRAVFDFDGRKAALDIASAGSVANPLTSDVLTGFHCPSALPMFNLADSGPPPGLPPASTSPGTAASTGQTR
ncbi:ImcF domain-containing protein [Caballeronia temeraria]|uniref:ImcF domain-containing protein n=1 Tax=Caballeronia temeraria TaxID=1777137 RepID=A0A158AA76_9BURK|nr:type VI secretion system membrane subunit TssM [Caballeronia temeraria]SAK54734.1 ImcF domain-containing protein [Caballeronia temeraria]